MRVIVSIPNHIASTIRNLIKEERFSSIQEFILTAMENQVQIENNPSIIEEISYQEPFKAEGLTSSIISEKYQALRIPSRRPSSIKSNTSKIDGFVWGQYYRIFPGKAICRILSNITDDYQFELKNVQSIAAPLMVSLKNILKKKDRGNSFDKIKLSTFLPTNEEKSIRRFNDQVIGYLQPSNSYPVGLLPSLNLVSFKNGGNKNSKQSIFPTTKCYEFAKLPNPILDGDNYDVPFSDEEVDFIITKIISEVEMEGNHLLHFLRIIQNSSVTIDTIYEKMKTFYLDFEDTKEMSNKGLQTMAGGVLSRSFELNLVLKSRVKNKTYYDLSDSGKKYIKVLNKKFSE